jgi:hypothetical protein
MAPHARNSPLHDANSFCDGQFSANRGDIDHDSRSSPPKKRFQRRGGHEVARSPPGSDARMKLATSSEITGDTFVLLGIHAPAQCLAAFHLRALPSGCPSHALPVAECRGLLSATLGIQVVRVGRGEPGIPRASSRTFCGQFHGQTQSRCPSMNRTVTRGVIRHIPADLTAIGTVSRGEM